MCCAISCDLLPQSCDRISIKLQLTGKSCLIFQFQLTGLVQFYNLPGSVSHAFIKSLYPPAFNLLLWIIFMMFILREVSVCWIQAHTHFTFFQLAYPSAALDTCRVSVDHPPIFLLFVLLKQHGYRAKVAFIPSHFKNSLSRTVYFIFNGTQLKTQNTPFKWIFHRRPNSHSVIISVVLINLARSMEKDLSHKN